MDPREATISDLLETGGAGDAMEMATSMTDMLSRDGVVARHEKLPEAVAARLAAAEAEEERRRRVKEEEEVKLKAEAELAASKRKKKRKGKATKAKAKPAPALKRAGGGYVLPAEPTERITHPHVMSLFDADRDAKMGTPYQLQGDPTMETEAALAKRRAIAGNKGVVRTIEKFMELYAWSERGTVTRGSYYDMHRKIVNALLPGATQPEAMALARGDWERDSAGAKELSRPQVFQAVFQLVDIWTASVDVAEYLALTNALYYRLKLGDKAADLISKSAVISSRRASVASSEASAKAAAEAPAAGVEDVGAGAGAGAGASASAESKE